jgi:uncharacterized protein
MAYEEKLKKLEDILKEYEEVAVAFSGGVDSTFLVLFAHKVLGDKVVAATASAPNFAPDEIEYAQKVCREHGIRHQVIELSDNILEAFAHNPPDRCYICKRLVFGQMMAQIRRHFPAAEIVDGTNVDDMQDYRPGRKALEELGIDSPLKKAGMTKDDIRRGLKDLGGEIWNKPAFACLASRIPYGEHITIDKLKQIHKAEMELRYLGFEQVRVRHHGNLARIEVPRDQRSQFADPELMDHVTRIIKDCGFLYATLDLEGYRMGSLNEEVL